jgi:hypothetical protein
MEQIQGMNRTLQENSYKDQLVSDVDKSAFRLVRGTYQEFGKIVYANRKFCQMLGYTQELLNSGDKTINMIMPQLREAPHFPQYLQGGDGEPCLHPAAVAAVHYATATSRPSSVTSSSTTTSSTDTCSARWSTPRSTSTSSRTRNSSP